MAVWGTASAIHALVVGGNGGIGREFVRQLLAEPMVQRVYATYRDRATATDLFKLTAGQGDRLVLLPLDILNEAQIQATVNTIQQTSPQLQLVINCVGILHGAPQGEPIQPEKRLRQVNLDQLTTYFQINAAGAVLLAKHLLPLLKHGEPSVFATISAKIGSIGDNFLGGWYGYRASKAALNMLMRTTAIEYHRQAPQVIIANLHPGTTDTRLSEPFQRNVPPEKLFSSERTVSQLLQVIAALTPDDHGEFFNWDGTRLPW